MNLVAGEQKKFCLCSGQLFLTQSGCKALITRVVSDLKETKKYVYIIGWGEFEVDDDGVIKYEPKEGDEVITGHYLRGLNLETKLKVFKEIC